MIEPRAWRLKTHRRAQIPQPKLFWLKSQAQIRQPNIENSTAQLQIDCLRSAHKFCYL